jgi:hypothetical protein
MAQSLIVKIAEQVPERNLVEGQELHDLTVGNGMVFYNDSAIAKQ